MENTLIKNIVIYKPSGADFCHSLAYKELGVEHLDGVRFLNFEYKGNRIASFDAVDQPCISVETEPLTGTTTLSLRDNKPVVVIQGRNSFANFVSFRSVAQYSTLPVTSGFSEGLKIRFQPVVLSKKQNAALHRYNIVDEQKGVNLGVFLVPANGSEMTLAFEEGVSDTQKRLIIGTSAFIIADTFKVKMMTDYAIWGLVLFFFAVFLIVLYFQ